MTEFSGYLVITGFLILIVAFSLAYGLTTGNYSVQFGSYLTYSGLDNLPSQPINCDDAIEGQTCYTGVLAMVGAWLQFIFLIVIAIIWFIFGSAIYLIRAIVVMIILLFNIFALLPIIFNLLVLMPILFVWLYLTVKMIRG